MMTREDIKLHELEGGKNPFDVPEGYFETFNERLMARLPQARQPQKTVRLVPRLWRYAAAAVFIFGVGTALYWQRSTSQPSELYADSSMTQEEEYYNDALDYIMVDNMEIAQYLTEAH